MNETTQTRPASDKPTTPRDRLIIALDFPTGEDALRMVDRLGEEILWYKIGMELFYAEGPGLIGEIAGRGKEVFLDLKLHDIPNTMAAAARNLVRQGVGLATLHVQAGPAALRAVAEAVSETAGELSRRSPKLLGVTRLTSLAPPDPDHPWDDVVEMARTAIDSGLQGWIAPVAAAKRLRSEFGSEPMLVCPGIRLPEGVLGDQVSVGTPENAIEGGADQIVVGRPVTRADDPCSAAREILGRLG